MDFGEAFAKAGITPEDFIDNGSLISSSFPVRKEYQGQISRLRNILEARYKWEKGARSRILDEWVARQSPDIIHMLKIIKNRRLYILPREKCIQYFDAWLGYSTKYQRFVLKCNPGVTLRDLPTEMQFEVVDDDMALLYLLNNMTQEDIENLIISIFEDDKNMIVPFEQFDPVQENNSLAMSSLCHTKDLVDPERVKLIFNGSDPEVKIVPKFIEEGKLHHNVIELFCISNNIKIRESDGVGTYMNFIHCSDNLDFKDKNHVEFYMTL